MLGILKRAAARLPHPLLYRLYLAWSWRRLERVAESNRRRAGIPLLSERDLTGFRRSETVFILGSGPSINCISAERWRAMAEHDTIGLNLWPLHPFVPLIYCFEDMARTEAPYAALRQAFERRQEDYRDTLKIVDDCFSGDLIRDLPAGWKTDLFCVHTLPAVAREPSELEYCIRYLDHRDAFTASSRLVRVFKYGSNLIACVALSVRLGYKQIVLCGVDLRDQAYFYQDPALFPEFSQLEFLPRNEKHVTTLSLDWLVPASEVLLNLRRRVLEPRGVALYVESRSSALWPRIKEAPAATWEHDARRGP